MSSKHKSRYQHQEIFKDHCCDVDNYYRSQHGPQGPQGPMGPPGQSSSGEIISFSGVHFNRNDATNVHYIIPWDRFIFAVGDPSTSIRPFTAALITQILPFRSAPGVYVASNPVVTVDVPIAFEAGTEGSITLTLGYLIPLNENTSYNFVPSSITVNIPSSVFLVAGEFKYSPVPGPTATFTQGTKLAVQFTHTNVMNINQAQFGIVFDFLLSTPTK